MATSSYICVSCRQRALSAVKPSQLNSVRRAFSSRTLTFTSATPDPLASRASRCLMRSKEGSLRISSIPSFTLRSQTAVRWLSSGSVYMRSTQTTIGSSQPDTTTPPPSAPDKSIITILPRARERLRAIAKTSDQPIRLRISVLPGGCHGFQYIFTLEDLSSPNSATSPQEEFDPEEDREFGDDADGAKVVVDESSLEVIGGAKVDYAMELIGSQFKVVDIPGASSSCGCGASFDVQE
ncbi:hypothetical protein P152DRAFT_514028 [Eremomyces bilateralis CBS 781.70]|uniref:FeS cluster biogenesis domain-containing protein n=1 Tax=Eremomyces bilateralis CBS 781.70 TaxID=1392243 RepID=A0A6G1G4V6_9PEZI|nr:uncharacterized protein P152DRAFT_514028 [Eremomyces bilateralis CBS 781.70]KAF1813032.1 hypothetical protein P152DRAFT_514028 [Eremomyces bilateralis CBS 781.70]